MNLSILILFITTLLVSIIFIKFIIKICFEKKMFDEPTDIRKIHKIAIPNLAGVGFFFTILLSVLTFSKQIKYSININFALVGIVLIFLFGLKDDLVGLSSSKRFLVQIFSGLIFIVFGNFRINYLPFFGDINLHYSLSVILSLIFFVTIVNAYNLIDGINGLLGSITLISSICFSIIFFLNPDIFLLTLSISIFAAITGFLFYNFGDAKIFMGSSGAYTIGALMYFISISYLNSPINLFIPKFTLLFSILAIPIYDLIRVFFLRIKNFKSPFVGDGNHIHHILFRLTLSHSKVVYILTGLNISLFLVIFLFPKFSDKSLLVINILILLLFNLLIKISKK